MGSIATGHADLLSFNAADVKVNKFNFSLTGKNIKINSCHKFIMIAKI
jgi:hypothetical protein